MSDSDAGETSSFKINHFEPVTNVEGTTMLVTGRMMIIKLRLLLQHRNITNTKREKIKEREKHHQNLCRQIKGILPACSENSVEESNSTNSHRFQIIC